MLLRVPAEEFVRAAREACGAERGYVSAMPNGSLLSAGGRGAVVHASSPHPPTAARARLEEEGFPSAPGRWSLEAEFQPSLDPAAPPFVVAVAYATGTEKPGLWMDAASASRPTGEVLERLYAEFVEAGELAGMTYDAFVEAAHPTLLELSPEAIRAMLSASEGPPED